MIDALSSKQLLKAAALKDKIGALEKELAKVLGCTSMTSSAHPGKKRHMSAAGRAAIVRAQKIRWAKFKAAAK
jgi:hypothetical protein